MKTGYSATLPQMQPLALEKISHLDLYNLMREAMVDGGMIGLAAGESLLPFGVVKKTEEDGVNLQYSGTYLSTTAASKAISVMLTKWPKDYINGRYYWFNNLGEVISPPFDAKANIVSKPVPGLQALFEIWSLSQTARTAVIWDSEGIARTISSYQIPTMLLATLPLAQLRYVLTHFEVLGQGFLRYYVGQASTCTTLTNAGACQVVKALARLKSFPVYGTSEVLRELAKKDWVWATNH
jgi:hypothetical protein